MALSITSLEQMHSILPLMTGNDVRWLAVVPKLIENDVQVPDLAAFVQLPQSEVAKACVLVGFPAPATAQVDALSGLLNRPGAFPEEPSADEVRGPSP